MKGAFLFAFLEVTVLGDFPLCWIGFDLWYNDKIEIEGEIMNIQQLRYVVAIANSGTFVKRLRKCMLASRVYLFL